MEKSKSAENMNETEQVAAIREQFQAHRQTCKACAATSGGMCSTGMEFVARMEKAERGIKRDAYPGISADAQFIAGKIVKHLWVIFVLLPVMLAVLFAILKAF
jgi:hypothetical protein